METLQKENADLKKRMKKLRDDNSQLRRAKTELERKLEVYRKSSRG